MSIVTAVYERGMLRLLQPVALAERQKVRIQLLPEDSADMVDEVLQGLVAAGLLTAPSDRSNAEPLSAAKRQDLADRLGSLPGRLLSEIIIEERGPR